MDRTFQISLQATNKKFQVHQHLRLRPQNSRTSSKALLNSSASQDQVYQNLQIKFKFKIKLETFEFIFDKANQGIHRDCSTNILKSIK